MRAAAFDLSSNTGIAVWDGESAAPLLLKKRVLYWDRDEGVMLEHWRQWLGRFFDEHQPEIVGIEAPAIGGHSDAPTIYRQAMIRGFLLWACNVKGVRAHSYPPASWRKTFIGFGSRRRREGDPPVNWKHLAMQRCRALKWPYPDHNAAEAAGVLTHMLLDRDAVPIDQRPPWWVTDELTLPLPEIALVHSR